MRFRKSFKIRTTRSAFNGMTFLEIVIAMAILAIALMPIFSLIHKDVVDTDLVASQTFAVNTAADILNSLLDNIPFEAIRKGSPATIGLEDLKDLKEYKDFVAPTKKLAKMLFPGNNEVNNGEWRCLGVITDPRGISYRAILRVDDIIDDEKLSSPEESAYKIDGSEFAPRKALTFSYCENPALLLSPNWCEKSYISPNQKGMPLYERHLGGQISVSPESIYNKPDYLKPRTIRFTQNLASDKLNYVKTSAEYCTLKRLIIEIQWNLEKSFYKKPEEAEKGNVQRIHLMTIKGDLSR